MTFSKEMCDLLGGIVAMCAFLFVDAIFLARMAGGQEIERVFGILLLLLFLPAAYLLVSAFDLRRSGIYFVWLGLFMLFVLVELLLDYVFHVPFRQIRWQVILYVMLFFGSFGGMIGVASLAGRTWGVTATLGFFTVAILAFVQHRVTGL